MADTTHRTARLDAAEYEVGRAAAQANLIAGDRRHTTFRRRLASQEAALAYAIVALIQDWRRLDALMYPDQGADPDQIGTRPSQEGED